MTKPILLSGITPSGAMHIGNYLGAIKQWVELQKTHQVFVMIADLHAITVPQDPSALHENTLRMAKLLIACGINPEQSVLFVQSHVPAHAELGWILNTMTPLGELERMTQFKEKQEKAGTLAGLLTYPTLMAADILLYQTDAVPVGDDQSQHVELTRSLARRFNNRFDQIFKEPRPYINNDTKRIMALNDPTKKMSKSAENATSYILLLDSPDEIRRKIRAAVTNSQPGIERDAANDPAIANLLNIFSAFSNIPTSKILKDYVGKGYGQFKQDLAELLVEKLEPIQKKYREFSQTEIRDILKSGAKTANMVASKTLKTAKEKIGLLLD